MRFDAYTEAERVTFIARYYRCDCFTIVLFYVQMNKEKRKQKKENKSLFFRVKLKYQSLERALVKVDSNPSDQKFPRF